MVSMAVKFVLVCCKERFGSSIPVSKALKEMDHFIIDYIVLSFYDFAVIQTPNEDFLPIHEVHYNIALFFPSYAIISLYLLLPSTQFSLFFLQCELLVCNIFLLSILIIS